MLSLQYIVPAQYSAQDLTLKRKKLKTDFRGAVTFFQKGRGKAKGGGGGIGKAGSLALCALPIDGRDRDREYIGNLRDNNIVMATVEFSLDSSE